MVQPFHQEGNALVWGMNHETLRIEPWGKDCLRVRSTREAELQDTAWALLTPPRPRPASKFQMSAAGCAAAAFKLRSSRMAPCASPERPGAFVGRNAAQGGDAAAREYRANHSPLWHIEVRFRAQDGERFYGLGQHTHGLLDQKGCVIELMQRNTQVSIPSWFPTAATASCGITRLSAGGTGPGRDALGGGGRPPGRLPGHGWRRLQ